jgi:phage gpG-like protein
VAGARTAVVNLRSITARLPHAGQAAAKAMGALMVRATQEELSRGAHPKGTPGSPAGTPPWVVRGSMRRSVKAGPVTGGGNRWETTVGATVVYARIHELGGDTGRGHRTHLEPRPYLRPALARIEADGRLHSVAIRAAYNAMRG